MLLFVCFHFAFIHSCLASEGWTRGRSSWYGTDDRFVQPYSSRGGGYSAWGILEWGSCGLTNGDGALTVRRDEAAAIGDQNSDFINAPCGRCVEVRCVPGPVLGRRNQPIPISQGLFDFASVANVTDDSGRSFPGNPTQGQDFISAQCWDPQSSIVVKIIDICPCYYCPQTGPDAYCRYQESCCKSLDHVKSGQEAWDLSFWAFQKLAHPEYGVIMVDTRQVDCVTHKPIKASVSRSIYQDEPGLGWAWFSSGTPASNKNDFKVKSQGSGRNSSYAACSVHDKDGGQTLWARGLVTTSSPFLGAQSLQFSILARPASSAPPPLRIVLSYNSLSASMNPNEKPEIKFCQGDVRLAQLDTSAKASQDQSLWWTYSIPMSLFNCPESVIPSLNKLDIIATKPISFCLDDVFLS